jgi:hypothetical protein
VGATSKQPERPQAVRLTLRPLARDAPPVIRMRAALKVLLRAFGLRCTGIEWLGGPAVEEVPIPAPTMTQDATGAESRPGHTWTQPGAYAKAT